MCNFAESMTSRSDAGVFHVRALLLGVFYVCGSLLFVTSMLSKTTTLTNVSSNTCPTVRGVDQIIVLLVDALRPDFVLPALSPHYLDGVECSTVSARGVDGNGNGDRRSTLTYMEENLKRVAHPSHGFFFLSDTPTITAQRIKAITTGTTPAFLEVGTNLNTDEVQIDNILLQLRRRSILLGDDTWLNLFPDHQGNASFWKHTHALPPYNVSDFDTNDATVIADLMPLLLSETAEQAPDDYARLIIGHLLAVDHVGHRHHASHPAMYKKLSDINEMLRNVTKRLREERQTSMRTLLVVFGDHGMTNSGDHGGDSEGERDSFMYAELFESSRDSVHAPVNSSYKFQRKNNLTEKRWEDNIDEDLSRLKACRDVAGVHPGKLSAVHQVDLTPTLALLLGVPIPFSNVGRVIPEMVALSNPDVNMSASEECNWKQLTSYFEEAGLYIKPEWKDSNLSLRRRIAQMSHFARSIRMEIRRDGAFIGSSLCMVTALSLLRNGDIQQVICGRSVLGIGTLFLLVLRLLAVFANSFIIKESVEVFCLLQLLLIAALFVAPTKGRGRHASFLIVILLVLLRVAVPLVSRERSHITHTAEATSHLEMWLAKQFPEFHYNSVGIILGAALFVFSAPTMPHRLMGIVLGTVTAVCYGQPLIHHIGPFVFFALTFFFRGMGPLRYTALVLWSSSLCNDNYVASASIAVSGVLLPVVLTATRHLPVVPQALMLHLYMWVSFFAQGNQCLLNTVDLNASFVGLPFNSVALGSVFVLSRLCNAFLFAPIAVMITYGTDRARGWRVCYLLLYITLAQSAVSSFNGYIQKSHLMFFPIFCPKFIFDFCIGMAACIGYALAALLA